MTHLVLPTVNTKSPVVRSSGVVALTQQSVRAGQVSSRSCSNVCSSVHSCSYLTVTASFTILAIVPLPVTSPPRLSLAPQASLILYQVRCSALVEFRNGCPTMCSGELILTWLVGWNVQSANLTSPEHHCLITAA